MSTDTTLTAEQVIESQITSGNGKTRRACLRAYRSNELEPEPRIIIFDYQAGRSGRHAQNFLQNWQGHLLADDYGGYNALFSKPASPYTELGCWARASHKFFDLYNVKSFARHYSNRRPNKWHDKMQLMRDKSVC